VVFNQFWTQISASVIGGFKELIKASKTLLPILNALLKTYVEIGVANRSLTILDIMENHKNFIVHQIKISSWSSPSTKDSFKYLSNSVLLFVVSFSLKCILKASALAKYLGISTTVDASD